MKKMGSEILFSESFLKPENILFLFRQKHLQKKPSSASSQACPLSRSDTEALAAGIGRFAVSS